MTPALKRRAAIAALILALAAVVADTVYRAGPTQRTDLPVYLAGAERVMAGEDPLLATSSRDWPYVYPPTLAVLTAPLLSLPLRVSAGLWCLLSLGVMAGGVWVWSRQPEAALDSDGAEVAPSSPSDREAPQAQTGRPERLRWEVWLPLLLVALPTLSALLRGQVGPILLGLGLLAWRDLHRGRDVRAGALLALCAAIKLTPLLVIAGLVLARRWRAVGGAALGLVFCLVILPLPFLGPGETASSLAHFGDHMIVRPLRDPGAMNMTSNLSHVPNNQALTSLAARHLEGAPLWLAFGALALLVVGALVRAGWRLDLTSYGLLWGVPLLVAPVAWHHHHVVAFFTLAALGARRARGVLALFAVLALLHFAVKDLRPYGLLAIGTLAVLGASVWLCDRGAPQAAPGPEPEPEPAT
ncbi:MAG: DUF2029 domain-containing protein [Planctomycetes bacterium]|nr:DUF2029 domain-containing protein [Planctomycetota bacterium]